jgi:hypothetical protein
VLKDLIIFISQNSKTHVEFTIAKDLAKDIRVFWSFYDDKLVIKGLNMSIILYNKNILLPSRPIKFKLADQVVFLTSHKL